MIDCLLGYLYIKVNVPMYTKERTILDIFGYFFTLKIFYVNFGSIFWAFFATSTTL
jgi:hypothetical protein